MSVSIKRLGFFLAFDAALSFVSFYSAYLLRLNFEISEEFYAAFWGYFAILCALKIAAFAAFGVYRVPWRFFSLDGLQRLVWAHIAAYGSFLALFIIVSGLLGEATPLFPKSIPFIDGAISIVLIGALRASKRIVFERRAPRKAAKSIAVVGAHENGERIYRSLDRVKYAPRFFIDDDPLKRGQRIHGLEVADFEKLKALATKYGVTEAIIAPNPDGERLPLKELYDRLSDAGIKEARFARLSDSGVEHEKLKIEDLLARNPKDLDKEAIRSLVKGKTVLVTGAGGSIGGELSRLLTRYEAGELILVDSSEYNLYSICEEAPQAKPKLLNAVDREAVYKLFAETKPHIVLHAAAYKHVPLSEANPKSTAINNVIGAKNCVDAAIEYGVEVFTLISTDKAVRPTNVMGATKRVCELYLQNVPSGATRLAAVRFGNVLDSSGSVVPRFRRLIDEDKPLTVTHPEITRYFMLIGEACELVLQATSLAKGGEIFVLDMGEPVKIVDLANRMLALADKRELGIVYTGLRAGEKLYEELLINDGDKTAQYPSIFVGRPTKTDFAALSARIAALSQADDDEIAAILKAIAPEFNRNKGGKDVDLQRI
ncbi:MAG: polysaccharide biosynthesis protein [Helicobacteraceae bacterium]|jgi:UDP-N-acetyl-D-glucosamine 4,6-dehydratase|nr:polysaccharide biosynthesis protein [Helicobacteraceae bacterium]